MRIALIAIATTLLTPISASSAPANRTDSLPIGRCVNTGNHLEAPTENGWGGKVLTDDDFTNIASAGFTTVRIPVRWDTHAETAAPYTVDAAYLRRVRHLVDAARAANLNVIINSHNFLALHANPDSNRERLAGLWRQIAATFADTPRDHVWFEIENEPHDKLDNSNLNATFAGALAAIRATNPDRPVIIGGGFWSGIDSLATLELPKDPNVVPTFHYYEPFDFTHQGATWVDPSPAVGRVYGTKDDRLRLTRDVRKISAYIARTGKTPFMGEMGAYEQVPLGQRVKYMTSVRQAFDKLGIGICAWGYTNTFPLYDHSKKMWVPGMREAMGLAPKQ